MCSIKNLGFSETNFKAAFVQVLNPDGHGILRSLGKLMTGGHKHAWRNLETLKNFCCHFLKKNNKKNIYKMHKNINNIK